LKDQPDLNWRNPEVQEAILDVMRFWLDKGVDGFRVDVLWHLIKDREFRDNPPNPEFKPEDAPYNALLPAYSTDQPEVHALVASMQALLQAYDDRLLIGEIYLPINRLVVYYGQEGGGVHLPFNFHLVNLPWQARIIDAIVNEYEGALPPDGWPNWVLGNHDQRRLASRVGAAQARVAAMLLLTLRGTPTLYYGDEIGMHDLGIPHELLQDPQGKNLGPRHSRDPQRTPMQWNAGENAGFSVAPPWLPVADDFESVNVEAQRSDPTSLLTLYHRLIGLRRERPALSIGSFQPANPGGDLMAFKRKHREECILIVLNLGDRQEQATFEGCSGRVLLSTYLDREQDAICDRVDLRPDEGVVIDLTPGEKPNTPF
jgi:alpha-glucosidase